MLSILRTTECTYSESDFESRMIRYCKKKLFRKWFWIEDKMFLQRVYFQEFNASDFQDICLSSHLWKMHGMQFKWHPDPLDKPQWPMVIWEVVDYEKNDKMVIGLAQSIPGYSWINISKSYSHFHFYLSSVLSWSPLACCNEWCIDLIPSLWWKSFENCQGSCE